MPVVTPTAFYSSHVLGLNGNKIRLVQKNAQIYWYTFLTKSSSGIERNGVHKYCESDDKGSKDSEMTTTVLTR